MTDRIYSPLVTVCAAEQFMGPGPSLQICEAAGTGACMQSCELVAQNPEVRVILAQKAIDLARRGRGIDMGIGMTECLEYDTAEEAEIIMQTVRDFEALDADNSKKLYQTLWQLGSPKRLGREVAAISKNDPFHSNVVLVGPATAAEAKHALTDGYKDRSR